MAFNLILIFNLITNIMKKVWLITGCSSGFGKALAIKTLEQGYNVAVCARNTDDVQDIIKDHSETSISIKLDVTKQSDIDGAVKNVIEKFGRIDVLVNNAGIGYFGAIEESEEEEIRRMFEINFFGLVNMTKSVLPTMRSQKSGHIINITSIGGLIGNPGVGFYNATKFAVDGLSESLSKETAPLGIKVTIVAPSGFRTDWAGRSANESPVRIEDYESTAGKVKKTIRDSSGNQPGDPAKAAEAIIQVVESSQPPLRLLLGAAAFKNANLKLMDLKKDYDAWEAVSVGADRPK